MKPFLVACVVILASFSQATHTFASEEAFSKQEILDAPNLMELYSAVGISSEGKESVDLQLGGKMKHFLWKGDPEYNDFIEHMDLEFLRSLPDWKLMSLLSLASTETIERVLMRAEGTHPHFDSLVLAAWNGRLFILDALAMSTGMNVAIHPTTMFLSRIRTALLAVGAVVPPSIYLLISDSPNIALTALFSAMGVFVKVSLEDGVNRIVSSLMHGRISNSTQRLANHGERRNIATEINSRFLDFIGFSNQSLPRSTINQIIQISYGPSMRADIRFNGVIPAFEKWAGKKHRSPGACSSLF